MGAYSPFRGSKWNTNPRMTTSLNVLTPLPLVAMCDNITNGRSRSSLKDKGLILANLQSAQA